MLKRDLVYTAMRLAAKRFGQQDGTFSAAYFSETFCELAGSEGSLDGQMVVAMLWGRDDVDQIAPTCYFRVDTTHEFTPYWGKTK